MDVIASSAENECMRCGACCAAFRVAFHWSETETRSAFAVPFELATPIDPHRLAMRGTEGRAPRCVALDGSVGDSVRCTIYANRPSPCRDMRAAWSDGRPSEQCDRARARYGLKPLEALHARR